MFTDAVSHTGYTLTFSAGEVAQYLSGGYNNAPAYWDNLNLLNAGINIVQARPKLLWSLGYNGGVSATTGSVYSTYTNLNQAVNTRIIWAFAKRWQFRFKDSYFYSDDPFQPFFTFLSAPTPNNPNPVIYFPQTVLEQNQATGDITYLLGPHDSIDFYGAKVSSTTSGALPPVPADLIRFTVEFDHLRRRRVLPAPVQSPDQRRRRDTFSPPWILATGNRGPACKCSRAMSTTKLNPRISLSGWIGPELHRHERHCAAGLLPGWVPGRGRAQQLLERCRRRHLQLGSPAWQFLWNAVQPQHYEWRRLVWRGRFLPGGGDI